MKLVRKLCLSILLVVISQSTLAVNWVDIDVSSVTDKETTYVDADSVRAESSYNGLHKTAWVQKKYPKAQRVGGGKKSKLYRQTKEYWHVNCAKNRFEVEEIAYFTSKGVFVDSQRQSVYSTLSDSWNPAYPDSIGEGILRAICRM